MQLYRPVDILEARDNAEINHTPTNSKSWDRRDGSRYSIIKVPTQAALLVDPREFGFGPGTSIIVIDLSRIGRPDVLKQISATFQKCRNCGEVRWHQQKPMIAINTAMKESEVQFLISRTRFPFEYVWSHVQSPRILVLPAVGKAATVSTR